VKIVNLTPDPINIADEEGNIAITLHPSGKVAKIYLQHEFIQELFGAIVLRENYLEISDLPKPKDGVMYIVSEEIARIAKRLDVITPRAGSTTVHKDGQLMIVRGFQTFG
jgi:hypothetical protein